MPLETAVKQVASGPLLFTRTFTGVFSSGDYAFSRYLKRPANGEPG